MMALTFLEEGKPRLGANLINTLLRESPNTGVTALARYTYSLIKDEMPTSSFEDEYVPLDLNAKPEPKDEDMAEDADKEPADGDKDPEPAKP